MGYETIENVRQGKYFEIELNETDKQKSQEIIDNICKKLLINPVIENYKINLKEWNHQ